jgi:hypothetical protein
MAFAGASGAAVVARLSARKPSGSHRRVYLAGQWPCQPTGVSREQMLVAGTEGLRLTDNRQLKI